MSETPSTGVPWRLVLAVMAATILGIIASVLATYWLGARRDPRQPPMPETVSAVETVDFNQQGVGFRNELDAAITLQRFEWIDRESGLIAVPIDVAFDLYLQSREER